MYYHESTPFLSRKSKTEWFLVLMIPISQYYKADSNSNECQVNKISKIFTVIGEYLIYSQRAKSTHSFNHSTPQTTSMTELAEPTTEICVGFKNICWILGMLSCLHFSHCLSCEKTPQNKRAYAHIGISRTTRLGDENMQIPSLNIQIRIAYFHLVSRKKKADSTSGQNE